MRFRNWLEDYGADKEGQIRDLWNEIFKALLLGGNKADEVQRTLQDITGGAERQESAATTVVNRLKGILPKFKQIDPQLGQQADQAISWLGEEGMSNDDGVHSPQKKVEDLLKMMFGEERFHELLNTDDHASDSSGGLTKMDPAQQAPVGPGGMNQSTPPAPPDQQQPMPMGQPGQQPQVPPQPPMPNPTNPQQQMPVMAWRQWKGKRLQEVS